MPQKSEEQPPSERLRAAIYAQYPSLREFANAVEMEPTQLSGVLNRTKRPKVETLDRFSAALKRHPSELRRWYGYEVGADPQPRPHPWPSLDPDSRFSPKQIVAYLKEHPDPIFRERLARREERMTPEGFERLCLRIFRAQASNFRAIVETAEEVDGEPWDQPTNGSPTDGAIGK